MEVKYWKKNYLFDIDDITHSFQLQLKSGTIEVQIH